MYMRAYDRQLDQPDQSSENRRSCAVVITRPPEIVVCFKLIQKEEDEPQDLYAVFDSHPRPIHPDGAAFVFGTSATDIAEYLFDILPLGEKLPNNATLPTGLQWQAQLLSAVRADFFQHSGKDVRMSADAERALMSASCSILRMELDSEQLRSECASLKTENKRLHDEAEFLFVQKNELTYGEALDRSTSLVARKDSKNKGKARNLKNPLLESTPGASSSGSRKVGQHPVQCPNDPRICVGSQRSQSFDTEPTTKGARSKRIHRGVGMYRCDDNDLDHALQLQRDLLAEEDLLSAQTEALRISYGTFECGVCFDEISRDSIVQMDECTHPFCHTCALAYVQTRIGEHRYPILCPSCISEGDGKGAGGKSCLNPRRRIFTD